ncbi:hypothetical protein N8D56_11155 [Devosia sp. A8/3-2]|nr:hypothetical protein N8D56_11155 [Devosia sp. A8/3-2]
MVLALAGNYVARIGHARRAAAPCNAQSCVGHDSAEYHAGAAAQRAVGVDADFGGADSSEVFFMADAGPVEVGFTAQHEAAHIHIVADPAARVPATVILVGFHAATGGLAGQLAPAIAGIHAERKSRSSRRGRIEGAAAATIAAIPAKIGGECRSGD